MTRPPIADRIWSKVNRAGPQSAAAPGLGRCWLWTGRPNGDGYAQIGITVAVRTRRWIRVHRWVYEEFVAPIPDGLELDHLCRVRHCVNPAHLEPVTSRENCLRGESFAAVQARQTHCRRGHELNEENAYIYAAPGHTRRCCRRCNLLMAAAHRARKGAVS